MAILEKHFESRGMLVWSWPLRICVHDPASKWMDHFNTRDFVRSLARLHPLPADIEYPNVFLFPDGLEQADPDDIRNLGRYGYPPGIVIILEPRLKIPVDDGNIPESYVEGIGQIAEYTGAGGVFHLECPDDPADLLNRLIIELSHNQSLPAALRIMQVQGFYYYDEKLLTETKLEKIVSGIVEGLRAFMPNRVISVTSGLYGEIKDITGDELADMLERDAPWFGYDSERNEASGIAEITEVLYEERPQPVFNVVNKNFQWAQAGPRDAFPDEAGPDRGLDDDSDTYEIDEPQQPSDQPRFLQDRISPVDEPEKRLTGPLKYETDFLLHVRIGYADAAWSQGTMAFPADVVFEHSDAASEPVLIKFIDSVSGIVQSDYLLLKRTGNTASLSFPFKTGKTDTTYEARLYAYHQNRLIQEVVIRALVIDPDDPPRTLQPTTREDVFCARKQLNNPEERTAFNTVLQYEPDGIPGMEFHGAANAKPLQLNYTGALSTLIGEIKGRIEQAVVDLDNHPEDLYDENNVQLLHYLAYKGNDIFVNWLNEDHTLKGPFQLVASRDEFLPLDFVYTLPAPAEEAKLCEHAKKALEEGACKNCFDKSQYAPPYICPFGFWAFSEIVERQGKINTGEIASDFSLTVEPSKDRNILAILKNTVFATSKTVEKATPGLVSRVAQTIQGATDTAQEATDWTEWRNLVQNNPDSLILLVHIERDKVRGVDRMEIGDAEFLAKNLFDQNNLKAPGSGHAPFVVIIGCEPNNITYHGFDIASTLLRKGAAIVVSNFTKIRGRQAAPIVIQLVAFLQTFRGKEFTIGEIVLRLRQYLLAKGIMAGLSLMVYGDADWKIKI